MKQKAHTHTLGPYISREDQTRPLPELGSSRPPSPYQCEHGATTHTFSSTAESQRCLSGKVFLEFKSTVVASGFRNACFRMDEIKQWWTWTFEPDPPPV